MRQYRKLIDYQHVLERAVIVMDRWQDEGKIGVSDVVRLLNGEYYYYVTFERTDTQSGADTQGYALLKVSDHREAMAMARELFDGSYEDVFVEWQFDPRRYPHGLIGRYPEEKSGEVV